MYVPGTILNSGDISVNTKGKFPDLKELTFYLLETDNEQLLKLQMLWEKNEIKKIITIRWGEACYVTQCGN